MANTFVHGRLSTVQIGGTYFAGLTITYDEKLSDLTDITYTVSGGQTFGVQLPGYNFATGTISFIWDSSNKPLSGAYNMIPGTLMALVASPDGSELFTFSAYSGEFTWTGGPTAGPVKVTTSFTSSGTITR